MALEEALAQGTRLPWFVSGPRLHACLGMDGSGDGANLSNHTRTSCPLACSAASEEATWQNPQQPGSMSCLQRSSMTSTLRIARVSGSALQEFLSGIALRQVEAGDTAGVGVTSGLPLVAHKTVIILSSSSLTARVPFQDAGNAVRTSRTRPSSLG